MLSRLGDATPRTDQPQPCHNNTSPTSTFYNRHAYRPCRANTFRSVKEQISPYYDSRHRTNFDLAPAVERFLKKDEILITKETKKGSREINLKEGIYEMRVVGDTCLYLLVDASSAGNIKPIQVVKSLFAENGENLPENALMVTREETYLRNDAGELLPLDAIGYDSEEAYKAASGDIE